jgi:hypothetical protein
MGSKSTNKTEIPQYLEDASRAALQRATQIQEMGYMPYMGPEVAVVNPYEQAMAANVGGMASAFGLQAPASLDMGGMPTVTQGGITGYTSYPSYIASLEMLRDLRPDMYEGLTGMTRYDPITGAINPNFQSNMPVFDPAVSSNMPVVSDGGSGELNIYERMMRDREGPDAPMRPRLRPDNLGSGSASSGSGLFSGMRSARDSILDALGVV